MHHRFARREFGLLPEQADPDARPDEEVAVIGPVVAGQELHQRRLAGAVGPDQPDPLAGEDLERQLGEYGIADELPAEPCAEMRIMEVGSFSGLRAPAACSWIGRLVPAPIPE